MSLFRTSQADRAVAGMRGFFSDRESASGARESAETRALRLFREVAEEVPAYGRFLAAQGVDARSITTIEAFRKLPLSTKDNYYRQYPLPDLCWQGRLDRCDMVALSTGSTGEPAAWPRFVTDELVSTARFEQILNASFGARDRSTLAVICFALGNWVGGMYTLACCRHLAAKGYPLTVVSPGNNPAEILRALRTLGAHYDQHVLFGYPPFLKDVVDLGLAQGFDFSGKPTRLVMAGEVFSEEWRDWVCHRLGVTQPARATASLYGTADAGVLANETPLSIRIRRALARRPDAARLLFGEARLPTLCQYDPLHRFFEAEDGWLVFSGDGGAPLIRYKILDRGGVLSHEAMLQFLAEQQVELEPDVDAAAAGTPATALPFVYVFGRSHFALSFYGANVYPENVAVGLEQPELAARVTGKFVLEVRHDEAQGAGLVLHVELPRDAPADAELARSIAEHVRRHVERLNSEFTSYVPDARRTPHVELRPFADPEYFPAGVKHRYTRHA